MRIGWWLAEEEEVEDDCVCSMYRLKKDLTIIQPTYP